MSFGSLLGATRNNAQENDPSQWTFQISKILAFRSIIPEGSQSGLEEFKEFIREYR